MPYSLPSRYLPKIIQAGVFLLVALIAWNLARLSVVVLQATRAPALPVTVAQGSIPKPTESPTQRLLRAHLFGVSATTAAPETSLALTLQGTYAQGGGRGYAIISAAGGKAKVYTQGDKLPGNVHLTAVYTDRVLLTTTSGEETLRLIKPQSGDISLTASPLPPRNAKAGPSPLTRLLKSVPQSALGLNKFVKATPLRVGGRFLGYRVDPGTNPALFTRLGLRPGDVVTAINGLPLNTPGGALAAMRGLRNPENISLVVERNGHPITLHPGQR